MNEETTKPALAPASMFSILMKRHVAKEEDARTKEAARAARIAERIAARIEDDKRFIDLADLGYSIAHRHSLPLGEADRMMALVLETEGTPLFCRWFDPDQPYFPNGVLWAPLPAGPVSWIKGDTLSWDQASDLLSAPKGGGADIYDPLAAAVRFDRVLRRDLAIRREDACQVFGLAANELLDLCQPPREPAQPEEDATEAQEVDPPASSASAPAAADPEPVAPSAVAVEPDSASASPAALPEPVAGTAGADTEKPLERARRLTDRVEHWKRQGVRDYTARVADEEGLSVERVRQLLRKLEPKPAASPKNNKPRQKATFCSGLTQPTSRTR